MAGVSAGAVRPRDGYIQIAIRRKMYQAHRLAWLYVHGEWPRHQIDHINGNPADNRICNLRDVTQFENMQNLHGPLSRNKSGLLGVSRFLDYDLWRSRIMVNGKQTNKYFKTKELAHEAYLKAKAELHPFASICHR